MAYIMIYERNYVLNLFCNCPVVLWPMCFCILFFFLDFSGKCQGKSLCEGAQDKTSAFWYLRWYTSLKANMFICFICKVHHNISALLCQHLRFHHGLYTGKTLRLKCGEPGGSLSFCTYSGFKKHFICLHWDTVLSTNTIGSVDTPEENDEPSTCKTTPETYCLSLGEFKFSEIWVWSIEKGNHW